MDKDTKDIDPEMLKNLDLLMNYDVLEEEDNWVPLQNWDESQSVQDIEDEEKAEKSFTDSEGEQP